VVESLELVLSYLFGSLMPPLRVLVSVLHSYSEYQVISVHCKAAAALKSAETRHQSDQGVTLQLSCLVLGPPMTHVLWLKAVAIRIF